MHPNVHNIADYRRPRHPVPAVIPRPEPPRNAGSRMDTGIPSTQTLFKIGIGVLIGFVLSELKK